MWYVIQTLGGEEERTADMIRKMVSSCYMEKCFVPKRERMKKFHGVWNKVEEVLFHGYVFVVSEQPEKLYRELQQISRLTKVLGREDQYFFSLSKEDELFVREIGNRDYKTSISQIELMEGKQIRVIGGPLKGFVGDVVKMNLHKREVIIQVEFMGGQKKIHLGIEMIEDSSGSLHRI